MALLAAAALYARDWAVYSAPLDEYQRTGDERKIVVTATVGLGDEVLGAESDESASTITVTVRVRPDTRLKRAIGVWIPVVVTLRDALGDRTVRGARGETLRDLGMYRPQFVGPPDATTGIFFPVLQPATAIPVAILQGRVVSRGGCLWIQPAEGRELYLALWPPGSRLEQVGSGVAVVDASGAQVVTVGDRLRSVGGETKDVNDVIRFTGQKPPLACQVGEAYWRAYQVTRLP